MRRVLYCLVLTTMVLACLGTAEAHVIIGNQDFETGVANYGNHWWAPWPWDTFTICPDPNTGELTYFYRDWATGAVNLPIDNGFPQWENNGDFDPSYGGSFVASYGMTPMVDYSNGYDKPRKTGIQWIKKNPGNKYYSGIAQRFGCFTPGKTYEVSAWGVSSSQYSPADMRILVDPNGGNDARTAPISSDPVPNHPLGRYWMWSSTGNNRIGNWLDYDPGNHAPDVIGGYQIWDRVAVQFTATGPRATIFLLTDSTPWVPGTDEGEGLGIGWDQVDIREVGPTATTVGAANSAVDGTPVNLSGVVVTAVYPLSSGSPLFLQPGTLPPSYFIEAGDRSAGIMVRGADSVVRGDQLNLTGTVKISNGQRYIQPGSVTVTGTVSDPQPVGIANKAVGGGPEEHSAGVQAGAGLNNIGLLSTVWGTVTEAGFALDPADPTFWHYYFRVDDGSGVPAGTEPQWVQNPSFETFTPGYDPASWRKRQNLDSDTPLFVLFGCQGQFAPHTGSVCFGRGRGTGRSYAYQTVSNLTAGTSYTVSAYGLVGSVSGSPVVRVGADPTGSSNPDGTTVIWGPAVNTGGQWQKISQTFTATGTSACILLESDHRLAGGYGGDEVWSAFDDVSITTDSLQKKGIKVYSEALDFNQPAVGDYVGVTGVSAVEIPSGEVVPTRVLLLRSADDFRRLR